MRMRTFQFPAMAGERFQALQETLDKLASLGVDTSMQDEMMAEIDRLWHMIQIPEPQSIEVTPRFSGSVGTDNTRGCFVCKCRHNGAHGYQKNITLFVNSKSEGFWAESWFDGVGGRLDHRRREPSYLQFKIGTCDGHEGALEFLLNQISVNDGKLCKSSIAIARDAYLEKLRQEAEKTT